MYKIVLITFNADNILTSVFQLLLIYYFSET